MDSVELVMAVEEAFGIAISDQDASTAKTAGDLRDLILRACGTKTSRPTLTKSG
ncbi:hypothetical protein [Verrucomicrobium spinosum]|uniref:hypothetical protein n=1 Tax=Verrucomicrobium spinosum TaxID=2736 RepID=UPI00210A2054|nr:hypothetical protein [Verrucomicrobium spinosum]